MSGQDPRSVYAVNVTERVGQRPEDKPGLAKTPDAVKRPSEGVRLIVSDTTLIVIDPVTGHGLGPS